MTQETTQSTTGKVEGLEDNVDNLALPAAKEANFLNDPSVAEEVQAAIDKSKAVGGVAINNAQTAAELMRDRDQ